MALKSGVSTFRNFFRLTFIIHEKKFFGCIRGKCIQSMMFKEFNAAEILSPLDPSQRPLPTIRKLIRKLTYSNNTLNLRSFQKVRNIRLSHNIKIHLEHH